MSDFLLNCLSCFYIVNWLATIYCAHGVVYYTCRVLAYLFMQCTACSIRYYASLDHVVRGLLSELQHFQSLDDDLRSQGLIRVLDIGVSPIISLRHYPPRCLVTVVDTNPCFWGDLGVNWNDLERHTLQDFVPFEGENIGRIQDGSVDVVVTTAKLCSVRDVEQLLREIIRVLAPGGKYFFLEHGIGKDTSTYSWLQTLVHYPWSYLFGCQLTRDIRAMILKAGFSQVDLRSFVLTRQEFDCPLQLLIGQHIVGTAQKEVVSYPSEGPTADDTIVPEANIPITLKLFIWESL